MTESSHLEGYLKRLCWQVQAFIVIFVFAVIGMVLTLISHFLVDLDAETQTIVYANMFGLMAFILGIGWLIRTCFRMEG